MRNKFLIMDQTDNCATCLVAISRGDKLDVNGKIIEIINIIPVGHKFALNNIKKGEIIRKYGKIIGIATKDIKTGEWIHIHNIKSHYLEVSKHG
ncbi:MAG: UxaA family hydrolase [Candidatus Lokiarchaeota archaeon]|nr:UxaA family hydrolase [Candidatus Lokiarchaeota archaeon]